MQLHRACVFMLLVACAPAIDAGDGGGSSDSSTGSTNASTSVGVTVGMTTIPPTTTEATSSTTTADTTSADASDTDATTDATTGEPEPKPNGATCQDSPECASGHCFVVGTLGGICGECESDADCPGGGCTPPNPLTNPPLASMCNDGGYGAGCMEGDVCQDGLECVTVIDAPGVITVSTCSECMSDDECDPGSLCAPDISVMALTGVYRCVAAGTLANGQTCAYAGSGDESCSSGHCAIADVMGLLELGVCSECEIDEQCQPDQTCAPPQADLMKGFITPGMCV
jgi:hypothetical protein